MRRLRILYLGSATGTSHHRALALQRLNHQVTVIDPRRLLPGSGVMDSWIHHTGGLLLDQLISRRVLEHLKYTTFDLVWVDGGVLVTPAVIRELKNRFGLVVNYNIDDPFGGRDRWKWRNYLRAVGCYDLVVVVRACNVEEAYAAGAREVIRVSMSADEVAHAPRELTSEDRRRWDSSVLFAGTWMPERGPFLARLLQLGVPLSIFGDRWHKAKEWPSLRPHWRGPGIYKDDDYARAVQCAGVCLGLLSKGNRDLSTTRSFEIPYLGGVLCAERTFEHKQLYREDEEALFWSTPEECAEKCRRVLASPDLRWRIAARGRARCVHNRTTNQAVLQSILSTAMRQARGLTARAS